MGDNNNNNNNDNTEKKPKKLTKDGPGSAYLSKRRAAFSAEVWTPQQNSDEAPKRVIPKSPEAYQRIERTVRINILFSHLDANQLQELMDAMFEIGVDPEEEIVKQGEEGDNFYVVDSGEFAVFVSKAKGKEGEEAVKVATIGPGGSFGELALMYNCPRAATVKAVQKSVLWALDRATFRRILYDTTSKQRKLYESFLDNIPILDSLSKYEKYKVADVLKTVYHNDGEHIIVQGEAGKAFFILEEGTATVYRTVGDTKIELKKLNPGDYFGEIALLTNKTRAASVVANGPTKCVTLSSNAFNRLLGPCEEHLRRNMNMYRRVYEAFLEEVPILASVTHEELKKIADVLQPVNYGPGETIIKEGDPGDLFYIIESGCAQVTRHGQDKAILRKGDYFGEVALLHNHPRQATVTSMKEHPVTCVTLKRDDFVVLLGPCEEILRRNMENYKLYESYT